METLKTILSRKSVRSYTGEPITEEQLQLLLKVANAAPVGLSKYDTVHITVIRDKALLKEIDQNGAKFFGDPNRKTLYGAPCLILVSTNDTNNVPCANVAMIIHNMALAAIDMGLGCVNIYGSTIGLSLNKELTAKLNLPEGFIPTGALAVGPTADAYVEREIPSRIATDYIG